MNKFLKRFKWATAVYYIFNIIIGLILLTILVIPVAIANLFGAGFDVFNWLDRNFPIGPKKEDNDTT